MFISTVHFRKYIAGGVLLTVLFSGLVFFAPKAEAQSSRELMLAQISQLLQIVLALQAQLAAMDNTDSPSTAEGGFVDKNISIGSRVQTTDILRVRATAGANANWVNNIAAFTGGKVVNGPRSADGYTWWHVTYDSGTSGWSAENWLKKISSPTYKLPNRVSIDKFTAKARDLTAIHGPYVDLEWESTGTKDCNLFFDGRYIATRDSDDEYELSNTALTEKYGLSGFVGKHTFELRCQSEYTEKDRTVKDFETVYFEEEESKINSSATCSVSTDKSSYYYGETIKVNWDSKNANYTEFVSQYPKDGLSLPGDKLDEDGSVKVDADVIGNPRIELKATDENGDSATCVRTVNVKQQSVTLKANGEEVDDINADIDDKYDFTYYPRGEVEKCVITRSYSGGSNDKEILTHTWNKLVTGARNDDFGRFGALMYSLNGVLEEVSVECGMPSGSVKDTIDVNVSLSDERDTLLVEFNGREIYSQSNVTEVDALIACAEEINTSGGYGDDTAECFWGDESIRYTNGWKG